MNFSTSPVDLRPDHLEIVQDILGAHLPAGFKVWVFGSRANWMTKDSSDLDLAVEGPASLERGAMAGLEVAFEESALPYTVDVVDLRAVSREFRRIVEGQKVPLPAAAGQRVTGGEWREVPFSEAVLVNPPVSLERGATYPFVDMASVSGDSRSVYPSEHREFKGSGSRFQDGDTLMARITPCLENGKIARYKASEATKVAHGSTEFIVIRGRPGITDNDFAYYLTRWEEVRNYAIGQMTGTSGRQRVPVDSLDHLTVPLPPLADQRAIAHVLGALDDKIELNRRMNQTLEGMAGAIFRDWFVDFGPVRARMEGREPYLPQELWSLFPDALEDSELGEIPVGWQVRALGELTTTVKGRSYRSSQLAESDTALVTLKSFVRGGGYQLEGLKAFVGDYKPEQAIGPGEVIIACTDVTQAGQVIGHPALVEPSDKYSRLIASLDTIIIRPLSDEVQREYLYFICGTEAFINHTAAHSTGTTVLHLSVNAISSFEMAQPSPEILRHFTKIVSSLLEKRMEHQVENSNLAAQRDALLPRLVSGKVGWGKQK